MFIPTFSDLIEEEGLLDEVEASATVFVAAYRAELAVRKPGVARPVGRRSKFGKQP